MKRPISVSTKPAAGQEASLRVLGCMFIVNIPAAQWLVAKAGDITMSACVFGNRVGADGAGIQTLDGDVYLTMAGCLLATGDADFVHVDIGPRTTFNLSSVTFAKTVGKAFSKPLVVVRPGATGVVSGAVATPALRGRLLQFDPSRASESNAPVPLPESIRVTGVQAPGWSLPK